MKLDTITKPTSAVITVFVTLIVLLTVVAFLQAMTSEIVKTYFYETPPIGAFVPDLTEAEQQTFRIQKASPFFLPDGTVHLMEYSRDENDVNKFGARLEPDNIRVLNTDMEEIWTGKEKDNPHRYIDNFKRARDIDENFKRWLRDRQYITADFNKAFVIPVVTENNKVLIRWVYSLDDNYFTGYDKDGIVIGHFGTNGFVENKEQVTAFDGFGCTRAIVSHGKQRSPVLTWKTPRKIYELDLAKRTVETLVETEDEDIMFMVDLRYGHPYNEYNWGGPKPKEKPKNYRPAIGAITKSGKCYMLLQEPQKQITFQIPQEWIKENQSGQGYRIRAVIAAVEDKIYLKHSGSNRPQWDRKTMPIDKYIAMVNKQSYRYWEELYKLKPSGELEQLNSFKWDRLPIIKTHATNVFDPYQDQPILKKLTVASPVFYKGVLELLKKYPNINWQKMNPIFRDILSGTTEYLTPAHILPALGLSVLLAGAAFWHGWPRKRGLGEFGFWIIFVFVFNLAGLLTYLALNHFTVIHCHKCGKRRHIKATDCPECGQPLAKPVAKPTDLVMT